MDKRKTLIVIGAGAAGFFCAVNAARMNPHLKVLILEKSAKLLSKVRISGGGRCNVAHSCYDIEEIAGKYPRGKHFVRKAFHEFCTAETVEWFASRQVPIKTEADGRMFPISDSSQTIIDCLMREAAQYGVDILTNRGAVKVEHSGSLFQINGDPALVADFLCIATGGYPRLSMFDWITGLGHKVESPVPSLFTFNLPQHPITHLMGVAAEDALIRILAPGFWERGPLMITHWGLSGPAILKLSAWAARELADQDYQFKISVNWVPQATQQQLQEKFASLRTLRAPQKITGKNFFDLPQRLWTDLTVSAGIAGHLRWADLSSKHQHLLIANLTAQPFTVKGKTTFKEEFVTAGGIQLSEIDASTMQSKKMPRLFFAGETMDVDGLTGGFNFQHAWTSGHIAARTIARMAES